MSFPRWCMVVLIVATLEEARATEWSIWDSGGDSTAPSLTYPVSMALLPTGHPAFAAAHYDIGPYNPHLYYGWFDGNTWSYECADIYCELALGLHVVKTIVVDAQPFIVYRENENSYNNPDPSIFSIARYGAGAWYDRTLIYDLSVTGGGEATATPFLNAAAIAHTEAPAYPLYSAPGGFVHNQPEAVRLPYAAVVNGALAIAYTVNDATYPFDRQVWYAEWTGSTWSHSLVCSAPAGTGAAFCDICLVETPSGSPAVASMYSWFPQGEPGRLYYSEFTDGSWQTTLVADESAALQPAGAVALSFIGGQPWILYRACSPSNVTSLVALAQRATPGDWNVQGVLGVTCPRFVDLDLAAVPSSGQPVFAMAADNGVLVARGICRGDASCSGMVTWSDIDYFTAGLNNNEAAWRALFPNGPTCPFANLDVNGDGTVSWRDIDPLIARLNIDCW